MMKNISGKENTNYSVVLGIDTTGDRCSAGLARGDDVLGEVSVYAPREHSSRIISLVDKLLKDNRLDIHDLGGIAVSLGPGCFTGLRVGVATAKALAQGLNVPIVGIPTLDMIALNANHVSQFTPADSFLICPFVDARKEQVYTAVYALEGKEKSPKLKKLTEYMAVTVHELIKLLLAFKSQLPIIFLGSAVPVYGDVVKKKFGEQSIFAPEELWYPSASNIALAGAKRLRSKKRGDNLFKLKPIYIREPDIRSPRKNK